MTQETTGRSPAKSIGSTNKTLYIKGDDIQIWEKAQRFLKRYEDTGLSEYLTEHLRSVVAKYESIPEISLLEASSELLAEVDQRCGGKADGNSPLVSACEKLRLAIAGKRDSL